MRTVLFQPDIPQNVGAVLRLGACFNIAVDIVEPCGFIWDDKRLKRAGMDYTEKASLTRHSSWTAFQEYHKGSKGRILLFTTKAATPYHSFEFKPGDHLIFGRESAGVPDEVHEAAGARLIIPMAPEARSLNVAQSVSIAAAEALRQLNHWPA
ncbi:MAG: tRNA (cytidine(34)-2'-O)-methyltransferase [Rhodospirillaceae bacterium]|nr:tRNA (cytidine(34)-2'-O)-methyltransferase [Rhodospirillaceae bacterium]